MGYKIKNIYAGSTKVRPVNIRRDILSSTICYYPFRDDGVDATGKTTLSKAGTKTDLGYQFNTSGSITRNSGGESNSIFCSYWIKPITNPATSSNYSVQVGITAKGEMCYNLKHGESNYRNKIQYYKSGATYTSSSATIGTVDTWMHIAYGYDGTYAYYYKNGVKTNIVQSGYATRACKNFIGDVNSVGYNLIIADFIVDSVDRSGEVADFFNRTKSLYGL